MDKENDYIPDWYIGESEAAGLHNIKNIRKVTDEILERTTY